MILVECHPEPETALCDGPQSLTLPELEQFINDVSIVREAYKKRVNAYSQGMFKKMTKT